VERVWLMKTMRYLSVQLPPGLLHPSRTIYNSRSTIWRTWTASLLALVYDFID